MPLPAGPHKPGSFTKNFAWHGNGFRKLHDAIRAGFGGELAPVNRNVWRAACGLSDSDFLVAANFYLFNVVQGRENVIPVDELVRFAVMEPHSLSFDRLSLFTIHLSLGGRRRGVAGAEFPTVWANEFARLSLWQRGRWRRGALDEGTMDAFLAPRIQGVPDAKQKSRMNYRHLFELARYLPAASGEIHAHAEDWVANALFVAWDRRILAAPGAARTSDDLVRESVVEEDYKLLGVTVDEFVPMASAVAAQYAAAGGLARFNASSPASTIVAGASAAPASKGDLAWLTRAGADGAVERQVAQRLSQVRDRLQAMKLKAHYQHRCMACGEALLVGIDPERHYVEAAHIQPLGQPHNGPDHPGNMLVLCPNHHLQFDRGVIGVRMTAAGPVFTSRVLGDPLDGKAVLVQPPHAIDPVYVTWHHEFFGGS